MYFYDELKYERLMHNFRQETNWEQHICKCIDEQNWSFVLEITLDVCGRDKKVYTGWRGTEISLAFPVQFCKLANEKSDTKHANSSNKRNTKDKIEKSENEQRKQSKQQ